MPCGGESRPCGHDDACGPLDELVALHIDLGVFEALDRLPVHSSS